MRSKVFFWLDRAYKMRTDSMSEQIWTEFGFWNDSSSYAYSFQQIESFLNIYDILNVLYISFSCAASAIGGTLFWGFNDNSWWEP